LTKPPSFLKEVLSVSWLLLKIAVPTIAWVLLCYWAARRNLALGTGILYGGLLVFLILFFAHSNYKWKRKGFAGQERSDRSRKAIRELLDSVRTGQRENAAPPPRLDGPAKHMLVDYLKPEPLELSEVPAGQDAYVNFTAVTVDLDGTTWVDTDTLLCDQASFMSVAVRRVEGGYRLTLPKQKQPGPQLTFTPRRRVSVLNYAPVVEIVQEASAVGS
jgi:hypothetical protein